MRTPYARLSLLLVLALVLAGCGGKAEPNDTGPATTDPDVLPEGVTNILEGTVQGPDYAPIGNATVAINGFDANVTTDDGGYYRFESLPPRDYILTATKEGYRPKSQRAIIEDDKIFQLDFVLEEVPLDKPRHETRESTGLISCQVSYQTTPDNNQRPNCGQGIDPNNKQAHFFDVDAGAAQIQIELDWQEVTTAAKRLTITVETEGDTGIQFAFDMGEAPLKTVVSQSLLKTNLPQGGRIRVFVEAAPSITGDESATDAGIAFQQPFKVYFTIFYVEPGPPSFTVL